jgi:hypothetical protein
MDNADNPRKTAQERAQPSQRKKPVTPAARAPGRKSPKGRPGQGQLDRAKTNRKRKAKPEAKPKESADIGGVTKWTPEREVALLAAVGETANATKACKAVGISRQMLYTRLKEDLAFAKAYGLALDMGISGLEDVANTRAVDGIREPVIVQGRVVGTIAKYSDQLLMFLLRAHRPEKYRDNFHHTGVVRINDDPPETLEVARRIFYTLQVAMRAAKKEKAVRSPEETF